MNTIQSYKCPCCGDSLVFDANSGGLHCESCETDFTLDSLKQLYDAEEQSQQTSKFDWGNYTPRSFDPVENEALSGYSCPSCGAQITGDATLGATVCPYCGNATIIKKQFEGSLKPDYIIPFRFDKKAAMKSFEEACKKAPFLPDEFKNKKKIEEMAGVYIPFWMFDCDCHAAITYSAQQVTAWSDSRYDYIKTDFYRLMRSGSIAYANIPVDGSIKADDDYMEALEPFDYNEAVDFDTAYLSGFLADKYDISHEESIERANERVKKTTENAFMQTTTRFSSVIPQSSHVSFADGKIRYALLPVWMLNIKYEGQMYKYAINGQTGKVVGEYPICTKKRNRYFAKVFAISLAIAAAIGWAYLNLL